VWGPLKPHYAISASHSAGDDATATLEFWQRSGRSNGPAELLLVADCVEEVGVAAGLKS
jgi:hypothetical protein